jgi:hypothetical protein
MTGSWGGACRTPVHKKQVDFSDFSAYFHIEMRSFESAPPQGVKLKERRMECMANYEVGDYFFDLKRFFPDSIFNAITEVRVGSPEIILRTAALTRYIR